MPTLAEINALPPDAFNSMLGDIFERSPWVAERAEAGRPFPDIGALHSRMVHEVSAASPGQRLALLRAHPELAGREARTGEMTASSVSEQSSAGLHALTADELARMSALNAQYRRKFGFPFIIAVRGLDKDQVLAAMDRRLANDMQSELTTALAEVYKIAKLRLDRLTTEKT